MLFRQIFDHKSSTYTYLLAENYNSAALIIDPVIEQFELYKKLITELGLNLVYTIETHTHADHITASGKLKQEFNCKIVMGKQTKAMGFDLCIDDQQQLCLGNLKVTALYTPGHTNDCYCYLMTDRVFTGDTLLIRGSGRTDFQEGDSEQAYFSIFNKLLNLPDSTLVFPGHDYKGLTVSTIGEEKRHNPRLQVKNKEEYVSIMNNLNLPPPKLLDIALPVNLQCGL